MSRMQALLAHQGPLVHVDHSHRLTGRENVTGSWAPRWSMGRKAMPPKPSKQDVRMELSEVGIEMGLQKRRTL